LKRPSIFRIPELVLKVVLGESSDVIVNTAGVIPQTIIESGYKFRFDKLENALRSILTGYSSNQDET
jgi:NAD dependent epimerase/dehydratase family enzyme